MIMDNYQILMSSKDFVVFLHYEVYSDKRILDKLLNYIQEQFDLFNMEFDPIEKKIELKIKKTNIKKETNFSHTSLFYYDRLNSAFHSFITDTEVHNYILNRINNSSMISDKFLYERLMSVLDLMTNNVEQDISLLYSTTSIPDNSIYVYI